MDLPGFWMDIGQPKDYLKGVDLYLKSQKGQRRCIQSNQIQGNVVVHETAKVSETAVLGPNVIVGENCVIGDGVRL